jgi:hypothetical protein
VSQKCGAEVTDSDYQPVVALTHVAREADIEAALAEIRASGVIGGEPVKIRILD